MMNECGGVWVSCGGLSTLDKMSTHQTIAQLVILTRYGRSDEMIPNIPLGSGGSFYNPLRSGAHSGPEGANIYRKPKAFVLLPSEGEKQVKTWGRGGEARSGQDSAPGAS